MNRLQKIDVFETVERTVSIGIPFDQEDNDIYVDEWGFDKLPSDLWPDWVSFINSTIDTGLKFKINPPASEVGNLYELYIVLADNHPARPLSKTYTVTILVLKTLTIETK